MFDVDGDRIRPESQHTLDEIAQALRDHPDWKVSIEGHTDATGEAAHNLDLSRRRAESVKAALVAAGIPTARMATAGFGATRSIAPNDTDLGRAQNRRVEVVRTGAARN